MNDKSVAAIIGLQGVLVFILSILGYSLYIWQFVVAFPFPFSIPLAILSFYVAVKIFRNKKKDPIFHVYTLYCAYFGALNFATSSFIQIEMICSGISTLPIYFIIQILMNLQHPMNLFRILGGYFIVIPPLIMEIHLRGIKEDNSTDPFG